MMICAGCAVKKVHVLNINKTDRDINRAYEQALHGRYGAAFRTYKTIQSNFPHSSPGDKALFYMGILWAYPDNPRMNYKKALACFKRVLKNYPDTNLRMNARAWIHVLNDVIAKNRKIEELIQVNGEMKKKLEKLRTANSMLREQFKKIKEVDITTQKRKLEH